MAPATNSASRPACASASRTVGFGRAISARPRRLLAAHQHDENAKTPPERGLRGGRYWARTSDLRLVGAAPPQLSKSPLGGPRLPPADPSAGRRCDYPAKA